MSAPLSWKWLCSRPGFRQGHTPKRGRPCLAAVEQLEDRIVLNATAPIPLSNQSLNAVNAFLKIENSFEITQVEGLKLEADVIELKTNSLTAAQIDYFLKVDKDMLQIDGDFIGLGGSNTLDTGIDGILANLALPANLANDLEAKIIPAVQSAREATIAVIGELEQLTPAAQGSAAADGIITFAAKNAWPTSIDYGSFKAGDASVLNEAVAFAKIEYEFIGADANDLGPALGLQGAAAAGPAGELLQDFGVLTADAAPIHAPFVLLFGRDLIGNGVDAFINTANQFLDGQNAFLKFEQGVVDGYIGKIKSHPPAAEVDYFLKIDADLAQNDADLANVANVLLKDAAASAGSTTGNTLDLSQETMSSLQALVKTAQAAGAEAAALEQEALGIFGNLGDGGFLAGDGGTGADAVFDKHKGEIEVLSWSFGVSFAEIENSLISVDPNLGPALALSTGSTGSTTGTTSPGPAGGLLQDALVLAADANGAFTQNVAVVGAFLKLEDTIIQREEDFVAAEQAFINLGVQLPPAIVSYFTASDDNLLQIDSGLLGTSGSTGTAATPGLDSILEGLSGLPASYVASLQALAKQAESAQQALTGALAAVQNTGGLPAPTAADQVYMKHEFNHLQADTKHAFAAISANFAQIEDLLIGLLDPSNQQYGVQDSKNIADGAAQQVAVE
jgi:hypothetical protein